MRGVLKDGVGEMHLINRKYGADDGDSAWGEFRGSNEGPKFFKIPAPEQLRRRVASLWAIPQRQYLNIVACFED
jgi:hypothetical protein